MTTPPYLIEQLSLPADLDAAGPGTPDLNAADAAEFREFVDLCDELALQTWGNLDRSASAAARLQYWRDNPYSRLRLFFVRVDGRMVARSWIRYELQENLSSALLHVNVLDSFAGRGIGRALLQHAEALAAGDGRTILQTFTEHPADFDVDGPNLIKPATGTGALPAGASGVRFAGRAGYRLEQVERFSALEVPAAVDLDALARDALTRAGDYELLHWSDSCPEQDAAQLAVLMSRMSTDAPTGALSYEPERWDVARVRHVEDTWRRAGLSSLVAAARHRDTGELAAYTVLQVAADKPWLASQDDTLVAAGHRGHRLGMLVKILNLRRLHDGYPEVQRVITFNAAENDHMLGINIALGFKPAGYDGEWQRSVVGAGAGTPN
ncbi:GNAT family N-acetyltransferase [Arthrobacter sp. H-02-3]|uniref:GNAT family N-acetyltransferase n=1 Tax=Arthrobacter sp. H-02-3 TaxID=2703675 RepID=UPI000DD29B4F|nr:GNAT family N-acetyltransferase [Arthrobacter sp. H-02-3]PVZ61020.1 GNAT family N-acetyltransferase [Arthrobacter sp. H-02-3]